MKPYYEHGGITIYHGDCREVLPSLQPFDLLLTDPPYGIGAKWSKSEMRGKNGASRLWGNGETWDGATISQWVLDQAIEKAKNAIVWGGNYYTLPPSRCWLSWDKVQDFSGSHCELAWTNFDKPTRVFRMSRIDAHVNRAEYPKEHPTEKPPQLMRWCIEQAESVATVLDPFAGGGATGMAARALGKSAVLIEIEERYCEIAAKRFAQEVLPLEAAV